ncbi:hypothetical protein K440DRAFT_642822 [Wilcoxina mikolae CBS 423.85]|nr:hypothetical protein K440DRAFT_642822 [Wilcoxina mikolae CBS 423.85]
MAWTKSNTSTSAVTSTHHHYNKVLNNPPNTSTPVTCPRPHLNTIPNEEEGDPDDKLDPIFSPQVSWRLCSRRFRTSSMRPTSPYFQLNNLRSDPTARRAPVRPDANRLAANRLAANRPNPRPTPAANRQALEAERQKQAAEQRANKVTQQELAAVNREALADRKKETARASRNPGPAQSGQSAGQTETSRPPTYLPPTPMKS